MPIINEFKYLKPSKITDLLSMLSDYNQKAKILAGGTDLVVLMKENVLKPEYIIDIKGIDSLNQIKFENNVLSIGAGVTFSEIIESELINKYFPLLVEASQTVASIGIRNRATMVGNICSAVPSADAAPSLLVYEADVVVENLRGRKLVKMNDWFTGPKKTILKNDEFVSSINIKLPEKNCGHCYKKLGRYKGEDLAQAGVGILAFENEVKIAFCAVGHVPKRAYMIEQFLENKQITIEVLAQAKNLVDKEISPITDIRSSKEYRSHMIKTMLGRGLQEAIQNL